MIYEYLLHCEQSWTMNSIDYGQLIEYPFVAEVWGNFSSVAGVLFTFASVVLLGYTLSAQRKMNKSQIDINKKVLSQHLRAIRPFLVVESQWRFGYPINSCEIRCHFQNAPAKNITIYRRYSNGIHHEIRHMPAAFTSESFFVMDYSINQEEDHSLNVCVAQINFEDEENNQYVQSIIHPDNFKIEITFPTQLEQ